MKMMFAVLSIALFAASSVLAKPQVPIPVPPAARYNVPGTFVPIVSQSYDLNPDGSYAFQYSSADGSARQESGAIKNPGTVAEANSVSGSYTYVSDDGTPVTVNYIADENGFQPEGNSVDPAITRSVAAQVQEAAAVRSGVVPVPVAPGAVPPVARPIVPVPRPIVPVPPAAAYNPAVYNPAVYNPAVYNPAVYNPAVYNPAVYNPAVYRGYPGYRSPFYNPAFPQRVYPTAIPVTPAPLKE